MRIVSHLMVLSLTLCISGLAHAEEGSPPEGPPWTTNFWKAAKDSLVSNRPLLMLIVRPKSREDKSAVVPSAVELELSNRTLAPAYKEVNWGFVSVPASIDNEESRAYERLALRYAWYDKARVKMIVLNTETLRESGNYSYELEFWTKTTNTPSRVDSPGSTPSSNSTSLSGSQSGTAANSQKRVITLESFRHGVQVTMKDSAHYQKSYAPLQGRDRDVGRANVLQELIMADQRASKLEKSKRPLDFKKALRDEDWIVRYRAFQYLRNASPDILLDEAAVLLALDPKPTKLTHHGYGFGNHPFLGEIIDFLGESESPIATTALNSWVDPQRMKLSRDFEKRIAAALERRGNQQSLVILEPLLNKESSHFSLTEQVVGAITAIGLRDTKAKPQAIKLLKNAFPPALDESPSTTKQAYSPSYVRLSTLTVAKKVHQGLQELTERKVDFPEPYDTEGRRELIASW